MLAVEVAGADEGEEELREKARWYLDHGVRVVWLVLPETREVLVLETPGESRHGRGLALPAHADLPGLVVRVDDLFAQLDRA
jgi:Uma2 family endonuclease